MGRGIRHKAKARRQTTVEMDTSESDADMEASGLDSNAIEISERVYPETSYGGDSGRCVAKDHQGIALEVDDSGSDADIEAGGDDPEVIELSEHECTESTHDDDSDPGSISMYYDERGVLESKNSGLFETILDHYQPMDYTILDGQRLIACGGSDNYSLIWAPGSGKLIAELPKHTDSVSVVKFSPSGILVCSSSLDGTLHICYSTTGKMTSPSRKFDESPIEWFFWIKTDDYGDCLVVHVGMSIYFVHPYDQDEDAYVYSFASNYGEHKAVEISPDTSMKSQGCNQLRAIKLPYGPTLSKFHIHDFQGEQISCSAITPNGSLIAIASESGIIVLVSIPNNKLVQKLQEGDEMPVTALKFSGDSKYISAGYIDGKIVVFDVNIGCMRYSIVCDESPVSSILWIYPLDRIISAHKSGRISFVGGLCGTQIMAIDTKFGSINDMRFLENKTELLIATDFGICATIDISGI